MKSKELTTVQKSIETFQMINPQNAAYNLPYLWHLSGSIDREKLYTALFEVFNHHDVYHSWVSHGKLVADDKLVFRPRIVEINGNNFDKEVMDRVAFMANRPINIHCWPIQEVFLFFNVKEKSECYLFLNVSHMICDVYSAYEMINEISYLYNGGTIRTEDCDYYSVTCRVNKRRDLRAHKYFNSELSGLNITDQTSLKILPNDWRTNKDVRLNKSTFDKIIEESNKSEFEILLLLLLYVLSLYRITNKNRIIVGVPIANRRSNQRHIHGCYINNLPLVIAIKPKESLRSLLNRLSNKLKYLLKYQSYDTRGLNKNIINNSLTLYKNELNFNFSGMQSRNVPVNQTSPMFPLAMELENVKENMVLHIQTTQQYNAQNNAQIFGELINNLLMISLDLNLTVDDALSLMEPKIDRTLNMIENPLFQSTSKDGLTIVDYLNRASTMYPSRVAVKSDDSQMSYQTLDNLSNKIASRLNMLDNQFVVVSIDPGVNLVAIILGIFKSGKVYVPLDKYMPDDRKQLILNQLINPLIVTDYSNEIFGGNNLVIQVNDLMGPSSIRHSIKCKTNEENIAYMIFTSGSTGVPKGVQVSHRSLSSLLQICNNKFSDSTPLNWVLFHSYGFDYSIFEILGSLSSGGCLNIVPQSIRPYPDEVWNFIKNNSINVLTQTPSAFLSLQRADEHIKDRLESLQYIFVGGEDVKFGEFKSWFEKYGYTSPQVYNLYGLTEATIISTAHLVNKYDVLRQLMNNIGKPISNTTVEVLDSNGRYVIPGMTGELYVKGPAISNGYYHNKNKTRASFDLNLNKFKTGDLVKILPNGELQYIERIDNQVQVSGHRIELGEIENAIDSFNKVEFSYVKTDDFGIGDRRIVAYYSSSDYFDAKTLRDYLREKLPDYMVPSFLIEIDQFPMTVSGKIDVDKLPQPTFEEIYQNNQDEVLTDKPTTLNRIMKIWEQNLGKSIQEDIGFFDAGGTSVLISSIYYQILDAFKLTEEDLTMIDLFEYTTPRQVAEHIDQIRGVA